LQINAFENDNEFNGGEGFFEGCFLLSKETIFVADKERHTYPLSGNLF